MAEGHGTLNYNRFLGYTKSQDGKLVVVPEEAEVVRRIFREYLEGFSTKAIVRHLNEDHIRTPTGKDAWHPSTITSMLEKEKFCGDLLLQKYYTEDFLTHKTVKNDGKFPQYYVEDDHPPVVPKAIFFQVQGEVMRRSSLKDTPDRARFGSPVALAGRLVCGRCGRTLKHYIRPDPTLNDWRCRERAQVLSSNNRSRGGTCGCRIALEGEVIAPPTNS
jgi:site-specific DNA recombinase